jgi:hypothetical protein
MIRDRVLLSPTGSSTPGSSAPGRPKKRRVLKTLVILGGVVIVVVGGLALLAPTIASNMAPARVESAVNSKIKGSVKVDGVSLGWGAATRLGPITLFDPQGKPVAKVEINTPTTLWRIVSERWWSLSTIDAGTIDISGVADLVRNADGTTNLQSAIEPRQPASTPSGKTDTRKPSSSSGSGIERIKANVNITDFDINYKELASGGSIAQELGLKDLKGPIALNYSSTGTGSLVSKANLSATPTGAAASGSADPMKVSLDADISSLSGSNPQWPMPEVKTLKANVSNLPLTLADALAGMKGSLVRDVGPRADLSIDASVMPSNTAARVKLVSDGAKADLDLATQDGAIVARGGQAANAITLRSTEFLDQAPGLKDSIAKMALQVKLTKAPSLEISLESLRWPLPGAAGKTDLATADLRGHGALARIRVSQMSGTVMIDAASGGAGAPNAQSNQARTFSVEPIELVVSAQDLAKPVTITGGTRTTIDNAPGGEISLKATASGLLDANGHLRALDPTKKAGLAENVDAQLALKGVSNALLQPLIAGANLPLDLRTDVGPTLDVNLLAKADVQQLGQGGANGAPSELPPVDASVNIQSANIKADAGLRIASNVASLTGKGLTIQIASATGLAQRFLAAPGTPAKITLSGPGTVNVNVREFSAPLDKLSGADALAAVKTLINVEVSNLGVLPNLASAPVAAAETATSPAQPPAAPLQSQQPIQISRLTLNARLDGANPPSLDLNGAMTHEGAPFELAGNAKLDGIVGGKLPQSSGGVSQLIAFKPTAKFNLSNVPRSILNFVPGASSYGTSALAADDMASQISRAVRESIGNSVTVSLATQPSGANAQDAVLKVTSAAGGLALDANAAVTPTAANLSKFEAAVAMDPRTVNPVLASAAGANAQSQAAAPMQLAQPFRLMLKTTQAVTVPLKADASGATAPDLASASDLSISLTSDNDIAIENVPTGTDEQGRPRTTGLRVRNVHADVKAPISGLVATTDAKAAPSNKRLTASFGALAARSGDNATIADISGTASVTMTGDAPEAVVKIAGIDTAVAENLIGKPGLLSGALGDKADANLRVQPQGSGANAITQITADLTAPRVSEAKINMMMDQTKIALTQASTITWRPDAAFINNYLLASKTAPSANADPSVLDRGRETVNRVRSGLNRAKNAVTGTPEAPSALSLAQAAPITVRLSKLTIAKSQEANGQPTVGPLKPGIFELDAAIDAPSIGLVTPAPVDGPNARKPQVLTLEGLRVNAQQALNAPDLSLDLSIDKVQGAESTGAGGKKSGARVKISNLADSRGVVTTDKAILNLDADLVSFPTPVIDRLANQNGLLTELLGPIVTVNAVGRNVSKSATSAAGSLDVTMSSPRSTAKFQVDVRDGTLIQRDGQINFNILEIRPQLIELLGGALPVVGTMEKKREDQPGAIDARNMQIPIDGNLAKLNGAVTVDPGVARFQTKSIFGELVEALGGNSVGSIGNKLKPFTVTFTNGVASYDKFELPVGSFSLSTKGTVDLVQKRIDVVTYVPLFALSQKALGSFDPGIAGKLGVLDKNTLIPITTRGSLENPKTEINAGLFMQETGDRLLKDPAKTIGNILDDVLNKKNKDKDKPKKP